MGALNFQAARPWEAVMNTRAHSLELNRRSVRRSGALLPATLERVASEASAPIGHSTDSRRETSFWTRLSRRYRATLGRYLTSQREEDLQRAYDLGRLAVARGLGVLDMARLHQQALTHRLRQRVASDTGPELLEAAVMFFLEALSPFEARHRGFREANTRLQQLNSTLEQRNAELR